MKFLLFKLLKIKIAIVINTNNIFESKFKIK